MKTSTDVVVIGGTSEQERPSFIGQERASDRGVTGEAERGAGGLSSRQDRGSESSIPNDRNSL